MIFIHHVLRCHIYNNNIRYETYIKINIMKNVKSVKMKLLSQFIVVSLIPLFTVVVDGKPLEIMKVVLDIISVGYIGIVS